jgi:hypothetical protein
MLTLWPLGKTLEQMDEIFGDTANHEEEELMYNAISHVASTVQPVQHV